MIRPEVMGWATIFLLILFAFVLLPTHERFTDAQGRYTDVSPNAPARPSWMGGPTRDAIVQPGSVRPVDTSTAYSRTAPQVAALGAPMSNIPSAPVVGVGVGSGSSSSSTCWDLAEAAAGKFIDTHAFIDSLIKNGPKLQACMGNTPSTTVTPAQKACLEAAGTYLSVEEAKAACASDSSCTAVVGGRPGPIITYSKFSGDAKIVAFPPPDGAPPGTNVMKAYVKKPCSGGSSNLVMLPSPVSAAPRVTSTLGTTDPSISGMNGTYNSGIIPPSGSPWEGLRGLTTEMASVPTNPAFDAQTHPNPPLGNLRPTEPDMGLFGPGPYVLRKNLVACTCASQAAGCSVHPRQ